MNNNININNDKYNIAVVGLGTIGYGVCSIINNNHDLNLYAVADLDEEKIKQVKQIKNDIQTYKDYHDLFNDDNINLIVETMGGLHQAFELIKTSLEKQIPVVTANKEVVAAKYEELVNLSIKNNTPFYFEASVGGTIPIINSLYHYSYIDKIKEIKGIINGSTNFVLTKIQKDGLSYNEAITQAKELGYLEQNPSADLDGLDLMRKIVILSNIAYHTVLDINKVYTYSLSKVNDEYFAYIKNKYILKYLAESSVNNNKLSINIEPVLINNNSLLSSINYANNYIEFLGEYSDKISLSGMGAGRYPTSQAIVSDIIMIKNTKHVLDLKIDIKYDLIDESLNEYLILYNNHEFIKEKITRKELIDKLKDIAFYARII